MNAALRLGFPAALLAYLIWGSLPLYIRAMSHVSPFELLAHRIIWSVPTAILLIALAANWRDVKAAFTGPNLKWLALSSVLIGANWAIYIWAVNAGRAMEASLGYYINPLVNVLIGMLIFSETLRTAQWVAVAIAAVGVVIMAFAFGHVPWVALALCTTFACTASSASRWSSTAGRDSWSRSFCSRRSPSAGWSGSRRRKCLAAGWGRAAGISRC
jgi:chloramphenicol-sensitive protein RarD